MCTVSARKRRSGFGRRGSLRGKNFSTLLRKPHSLNGNVTSPVSSLNNPYVRLNVATRSTLPGSCREHCTGGYFLSSANRLPTLILRRRERSPVFPTSQWSDCMTEVDRGCTSEEKILPALRRRSTSLPYL